MGSEESKSPKEVDENGKQIKAIVDDSRAVDSKILLNPRQQELLRKSWQHSSSTGSASVGARIFRKIFATEPAIARIFGLDGVPSKDLAFNSQFESHANRFTKALDFAVHNLHDREKISEYAQALGAVHVKFESRGFKTAYWDVFAEAMTECAIDWESGVVVRYREAMHAWRLLVTFFIEEMRTGYQRERRKQSSHSVLSHNDDSPFSSQ